MENVKVASSTSENVTPPKELKKSFSLSSPSSSSSSSSSSSIAVALRFFDAAGVAFFFFWGLFFGVDVSFCLELTKKSLMDVNVETVAVLLARSRALRSEIVPLSKSIGSLVSSNVLSAADGSVAFSADSSFLFSFSFSF